MPISRFARRRPARYAGHARSARHARSAPLLVVPIAALLLAGCASGSGADSGDTDAATATGGAGASGFPLTIDNCGTEVTFEAAPERVVTVKSSTLELMLALGLEDRVIGTAFSDGPVPEAYADAASDLVMLSDNVPSQEVTLSAEPDLVFAGWESNLTAEGAGDRDALAALGVQSYVAPAACKGEGYMPNPLTFDEVFREFEEAGAIFGVPDAAADLVTEQRAALDAIEPNTDGLTALWYSSGDDTPFVGAGIGAPQMIMEAAGLENVAADVEDTWTSMGWEAIVEANPDVIVLVDAAWNTAEAKIAHLESNAATAALPGGAAASVCHRRLPVDRGGRSQRRRGGVDRRPAGGRSAPDDASAPPREQADSPRRHPKQVCRAVVSSAACLSGPRPGGRARRGRGGTGVRTATWAVALSVLLVASIVVAVTIGPAGLSPADVWASVLAHLGIGEPTLSPLRDGIVWELRMPRVLTAAAVGAGLALCGAVMQALTRNPLADPYLLGLSSGASVGAVVVIVLGVGLLLPFAAFAGALVALVATLALANAAGALTPTRTVLAGLAVSSVFGAITSLVIFWSATGDSYREILNWLLGSLAGTDWTSVAIAGGAVIVIGVPLLASAKTLDAFAFGDTAAAALGVHVGRSRAWLLTGTALLTGGLVAVSGAIGFVGLILPHAVRLLVGSRHRALLPLSALAGALFLIWADTGARTLFDPRELPVGILTALIGGPVFAVLMLRNRRLS